MRPSCGRDRGANIRAGGRGYVGVEVQEVVLMWCGFDEMAEIRLIRFWSAEISEILQNDQYSLSVVE